MAASHFLTGTHHCAILDGKEHGATHRQFSKCTLHPGHEKFMTVDEFLKKNHSEIGLRSDREMCNVRNVIARTVRVVVHHTSVHRPDTFLNSESPYPCKDIRGNNYLIRYGTGCLFGRNDDDENGDIDDDNSDEDDDYDNGDDYDYGIVDDNDDIDNNNDGNDNNENDVDNGNDDVPSYVKNPCPCPECKASTCQTPNRKSYFFIIQTATHVVFDEQEAQRAVFEFFYDTENKSNVEKLHGVTVLDTRHDRLQTDCCRVVCVTHDDSLAEKLGRLCKEDNHVWVDKVLVSHPHGVSKRISVGDYPDRTIVVIPNKESVQLKKGMAIRFPGCHDERRVAQDINRLLIKHVIVFDGVSKTLVLDYDLTIFRPEGIVVETDYNNYFDYNYQSGDLIRKNKVWCNVFHPGTQLVTDDGKRYTFLYNDTKVPRVKMEVFVKTAYFFDKNDKVKHSVFLYKRYNMPSCPGSSGARVVTTGHYLLHATLGHSHFGNCGHFNTSSLDCIHTPDGDEQENKTKHMIGTKWYIYIRGYRQGLYDKITGT